MSITIDPDVQRAINRLRTIVFYLAATTVFAYLYIALDISFLSGLNDFVDMRESLIQAKEFAFDKISVAIAFVTIGSLFISLLYYARWEGMLQRPIIYAMLAITLISGRLDFFDIPITARVVTSQFYCLSPIACLPMMISYLNQQDFSKAALLTTVKIGGLLFLLEGGLNVARLIFHLVSNPSLQANPMIYACNHLLIAIGFALGVVLYWSICKALREAIQSSRYIHSVLVHPVAYWSRVILTLLLALMGSFLLFFFLLIG